MSEAGQPRVLKCVLAFAERRAVSVPGPVTTPQPTPVPQPTPTPQPEHGHGDAPATTGALEPGTWVRRRSIQRGSPPLMLRQHIYGCAFAPCIAEEGVSCEGTPRQWGP